MDLNSKSIDLCFRWRFKGIAHAGAIKFLEEQNIRPTRIAGTSAGAIVGACIPGESPDEILDFFRSIFFSGGISLLRKQA
jgi:NTE family protein